MTQISAHDPSILSSTATLQLSRDEILLFFPDAARPFTPDGRPITAPAMVARLRQRRREALAQARTGGRQRRESRRMN